MSSINRVECSKCGSLCIEQEVACWQCGEPLRTPIPEAQTSKQQAVTGKQSLADGLIDFSDGNAKPSVEAVQPISRQAMTLTGEMVEIEEPASESVQRVLPTSFGANEQHIAAAIGTPLINAMPATTVMHLTFCKVCGQQNEEGVVECRKCRTPLEVVAIGSVNEIESLPRAWGFDLLAAAWVILGFAAVYGGWFLVKADPAHPGTTWADYFWTGIVVCAPGILIFIRHYFCKLLFWAMTLASILIWAVIGFIWLYVGLHVSANGQIGLAWLAVLSALSTLSYYTVRLNDAFDFGI